MTGPTSRIATWNILGRQEEGTHRTARAGAVRSVVTKHRPDVLCLQEVHFYDGEPDPQLMEELQLAGLDNFVGMPLSESHLDDSARLGVAIASRWVPLGGSHSFVLRNPGLRASVRGSEWVTHDKGAVGCDFRSPEGRIVRVLSVHLFPFHEFRAVSDQRHVDDMWREFWQRTDELRGPGGMIIAGDFNQVDREVAARRWSKNKWYFCTDRQPTTSMGKSLDDIVLSSAPEAHTLDLDPTFSDHHFASVRARLGSAEQQAVPATSSRGW
jgi:endonuclease/exonuclease/phosphatase family metal-dependent hydrolase